MGRGPSFSDPDAEQGQYAQHMGCGVGQMWAPAPALALLLCDAGPGA